MNGVQKKIEVIAENIYKIAGEADVRDFEKLNNISYLVTTRLERALEGIEGVVKKTERLIEIDGIDFHIATVTNAVESAIKRKLKEGNK